MKTLIQILIFFIGIITVAGIHLITAYLLPYPFQNIHIIFIAILLFLFLYEHGNIVWFAALLFLFLDFSSIYPFGLATIAGVSATIVMLVLYRTVFTNRSLVAAIALLTIGYSIYRSFYILYEIIQYIFVSSVQTLYTYTIQIYIVQLLVTLAALVVIYSIISRFSYQLQHTSIHSAWFRNLKNDSSV